MFVSHNLRLPLLAKAAKSARAVLHMLHDLPDDVIRIAPRRFLEGGLVEESLSGEWWVEPFSTRRMGQSSIDFTFQVISATFSSWPASCG